MARHYSKLKAEIRAAWRRKAREVLESQGKPLPPDFQERVEGDGDLNPPDARRAARRAAVLATVALRGLASTWSHEDQVEFLPKLRSWFDAAELADEAEPAEAKIIAAPASELDQRSALNSAWRWEGVGVLVAAVGRLPLPSFEQPFDPKPCGDAAGLFAKREAFDELIASAAFAASFDRFAFADQMLAVHWRLTQWRVKPGEPADFVGYAQRIDWATFNLAGLPIVDGDLAIGGRKITQADAKNISMAISIVLERHRAANWLTGWNELYSAVETPT